MWQIIVILVLSLSPLMILSERKRLKNLYKYFIFFFFLYIGLGLFMVGISKLGIGEAKTILNLYGFPDRHMAEVVYKHNIREEKK